MPRKPMEALTESMFYMLMAFQTDEMCGMDIAESVEQHTGGRVRIGPATLYTILGKFENEGYIQETCVEGRKRTYRITDKGRAAYDAELLRLKLCILDSERPVRKATEEKECVSSTEQENSITVSSLALHTT